MSFTFDGSKSKVIEFTSFKTYWKKGELIRPSGGISLCLRSPAHSPNDDARNTLRVPSRGIGGLEFARYDELDFVGKIGKYTISRKVRWPHSTTQLFSKHIPYFLRIKRIACNSGE